MLGDIGCVHDAERRVERVPTRHGGTLLRRVAACTVARDGEIGSTRHDGLVIQLVDERSRVEGHGTISGQDARGKQADRQEHETDVGAQLQSHGKQVLVDCGTP